MTDLKIYISSDIEKEIAPYLHELGYLILTEGAIEKVGRDNVELAIMGAIYKNLDFALNISTELSIPVMLITADNNEKINSTEIDMINPVSLLALPGNAHELKINLNSILRNIASYKEKNSNNLWFKGVLNTTKDAVIAIDSDGTIKFMNPMAQHISGVEEIKALGLSADRVLQFKSTTNRKLSITDSENKNESEAFEGELYNRITKAYIHVSGNLTMIKDHDGLYCGKVLTLKDVGEIRSLFSRINYQSSHDNLTGILNRKSFINYADQLISLSKYDASVHGLIIISLDKFKVVNDTCGHIAGDELLRKIAYILKDSENDSFTVGRLGGDEFGVLLKNKSLSEIKHFTKAVKRKISKQEFIWGDKELQIMCSYGIVEISKNTPDHYNLFVAADDAIAIAKEKGGGRIEIYSDLGYEYSKRRGEMLWIHKLKDAIKNEQFKLYYQEIIPVKEGGIKKIEILVRLKNESGEIVSPIDFIPSAEHYGIMPEIDKIVIEKSIAVCKEIIDNKKIKDRYIFSVNISGTSIPDKSLPGFILSIFQKYKVPPTLFCFEITETAAIKNIDLAVSFINNLKRIGCKFSLDDFGSGFSNFFYLQNLDVDYLKIDGLFIADMMEEPINRAMVKSINKIGHIMKMKTVAEFVENNAIKEELINIGVDYLQGYAICKPTPIENLLL